MRALSFRQPMAHATLYGGRRIDNRPKWSWTKFRGTFLLHAHAVMFGGDLAEAERFAQERAIAWRPPATNSPELVRGALVGRARVVGVVREARDFERYPAFADQIRWWTGRFALLLADVEPFEVPVPWLGHLGFFDVTDDAFTRALASAIATRIQHRSPNDG